MRFESAGVVMAATNGNKTHAARVLGIDRRSLYRRLEAPRPEPEPSEKPAAPTPA